MKKKILAFSICIAMLAIALIGGTMAYFTDTDQAENVFTVGNIDIDLREWEKYVGDNSIENVKFSNIDGIMPGMTYDKIVNVKNKGKNDAYVQVTIDIPKDMTPVWNTETEWIGASTNPAEGSGRYVFTLNNPLGAGNCTSAILKAVTLNADVTEITAADNYKVIVNADAIQADSFATPADAYTALAAAVAEERYEEAANVDEMNNALQNTGKVVQMTNDVTSGNDIKMAAGAILDGNGYTLNKTSDADSAVNAGIDTKGGTIKNLIVTGDTFNEKGFRAVYATNGINNDLVIDGVTLSGTYALNITDESGVSKDYNLIVKNSKLNGWTSYAPLASAKFDNVTFGTSNTYHNLKPYANTVLNNCRFDEAFVMDAGAKVTITLNECNVNGTDVTAENFKTLFTLDREDKLFECTIVVDGVTVALN